MKSLILLTIFFIGFIASDNSDEDPDEGALPDEFCTKVYEQEGEGDTVPYCDVSNWINNYQMNDGYCEMDLHRDLMNFCDQQFFVGQYNSANQILKAQISFLNDNGQPCLDNQGFPLQFSSTKRTLGHIIPISYMNYPYTYARCRLQLQPDCDFNPDSLFFHFLKSTKNSCCYDGKKSDGETDQDCGGKCATIRKCPVGATCEKYSDCKSGFCHNITKICLPSYCNDNDKDRQETDVDCGGICAQGNKCDDGLKCNISNDCQSDLCLDGICLPLTCIDSDQDENETDIDCGGICSPKRKCCDYRKCQNNADCLSGICTNDICAPKNQCSNNCLNHCQPKFLITFGSGYDQILNATTNIFGFTTDLTFSYTQQPNDGNYVLINSLNNTFPFWFTLKMDHTPYDNGGYMYIVNTNQTNSTIFQYNVTNLCIGFCYEFSAYIANVNKFTTQQNSASANITFQVESISRVKILTYAKIGNLENNKEVTWIKLGVSFNATESAVILSMILNAVSGMGNHIAIDDIELRTCSSDQSRACSIGCVG
ncbi:unnamed protein product [Adineta ricciae]|uniref:Uncharacterized protein n=1 Tax=Adineta ricciae TaxID=249248 RepID=A0A814E947_ADIRI|nr:unnamed protein product [Adineta ricciae]CAF1195130.1 unnamed protein product [Adineta ricciae]